MIPRIRRSSHTPTGSSLILSKIAGGGFEWDEGRGGLTVSYTGYKLKFQYVKTQIGGSNVDLDWYSRDCYSHSVVLDG